MAFRFTVIVFFILTVRLIFRTSISLNINPIYSSLAYLIIGAPLISIFSLGTYPNVLLDYLVMVLLYFHFGNKVNISTIIAILLPLLHFTGLLISIYYLQYIIRKKVKSLKVALLVLLALSLSIFIFFMKAWELILLYMKPIFPPGFRCDLFHITLLFFTLIIRTSITYLYSLKVIGLIALLSLTFSEIRSNHISKLMLLNMIVAFLFSLSGAGITWRILMAYSYLYAGSFSQVVDRLNVRSWIALIAIVTSISTIHFIKVDYLQYAFLHHICSDNCEALFSREEFNRFVNLICPNG